MKAHSETHFENENIFLEKWKVIIPLKKRKCNKQKVYTYFLHAVYISSVYMIHIS